MSTWSILRLLALIAISVIVIGIIVANSIGIWYHNRTDKSDADKKTVSHRVMWASIGLAIGAIILFIVYLLVLNRAPREFTRDTGLVVYDAGGAVKSALGTVGERFKERRLARKSDSGDSGDIFGTSGETSPVYLVLGS